MGESLDLRMILRQVTYSSQSTASISVTSCAGSPIVSNTITIVTRPAWGIPAAPILANVAVILKLIIKYMYMLLVEYKILAFYKIVSLLKVTEFFKANPYLTYLTVRLSKVITR